MPGGASSKAASHSHVWNTPPPPRRTMSFHMCRSMARTPRAVSTRYSPTVSTAELAMVIPDTSAAGLEFTTVRSGPTQVVHRHDLETEFGTRSLLGRVQLVDRRTEHQDASVDTTIG